MSAPIDRWEKAVIAAGFENERKAIETLTQLYEEALQQCRATIGAMMSDGQTVSTANRERYHRWIEQQLQGILDTLRGNEFSTINDYLMKSYTNGFVGTFYAQHKRDGVTVIVPINESAVMHSLMDRTKLTDPLYEQLTDDLDELRGQIMVEITKGFMTGSTWSEIAWRINDATSIPMNKAKMIAKTEGHRIQQEAREDAAHEAKEKGCTVKKQWHATLDNRTRESHQMLDGQIVDVDEDFVTENGDTASSPGHFGIPAEDINCRCQMTTRAVWALDESELQTLRDRAEFYGLDKARSFADFERRYLNAANDQD